jgi:hypothetical protein
MVILITKGHHHLAQPQYSNGQFGSFFQSLGLCANSKAPMVILITKGHHHLAQPQYSNGQFGFFFQFLGLCANSKAPIVILITRGHHHLASPITRRPAHHDERSHPAAHARFPFHCRPSSRRVCELFQDPDDDLLIKPLALLIQQRHANLRGVCIA